MLKVKQMLTMHSIHPFWSTLQIKSAVFCQYFFVAQHQWLCHRCSVFKNLQCLFLNWSNSTMNDNACFPFNLRHNISMLWWQTDAASDGHVEKIAELYIYIYMHYMYRYMYCIYIYHAVPQRITIKTYQTPVIAGQGKPWPMWRHISGVSMTKCQVWSERTRTRGIPGVWGTSPRLVVFCCCADRIILTLAGGQWALRRETGLLFSWKVFISPCTFKKESYFL